MRGDGPLADRSLLAPGRQIAPAGHAPRLESRTDSAICGLLVSERDADPEEGKWIYAGKPAEVRR